MQVVLKSEVSVDENGKETMPSKAIGVESSTLINLDIMVEEHRSVIVLYLVVMSM